jgi:hypothetical protein
MKLLFPLDICAMSCRVPGRWRSALQQVAAATVSLLTATTVLTGCGGGGAGDPTSVASATSSCAATLAATTIGPFTVATGDCVLGYTITQAQIDSWAASGGNVLPFRQQLLTDLAANFSTTFDIVFVVVPDAPSTLPFVAANFTNGDCVPGATGCSRAPTLGMLALLTTDAFQLGPTLHEVLHGYTIPAQGSNQSIVPTSNRSHWGFSSVGGQLGGWDASTLKGLGANSYQAAEPPLTLTSLATIPAARPSFGEFANGGNGLPYGNLELYLMGLIDATQLQPVTYAVNPAWVSPGNGTFTAASLVVLSAQQLAASLPANFEAYRQSAPKHPRGVVVLASTTGGLPADRVASLNNGIDQFTLQGEPDVWNSGVQFKLFNFWSATGGRASMTLNQLSTLRKH